MTMYMDKVAARKDALVHALVENYFTMRKQAMFKQAAPRDQRWSSQMPRAIDNAQMGYERLKQAPAAYVADMGDRVEGVQDALGENLNNAYQGGKRMVGAAKKGLGRLFNKGKMLVERVKQAPANLASDMGGGYEAIQNELGDEMNNVYQSGKGMYEAAKRGLGRAVDKGKMMYYRNRANNAKGQAKNLETLGRVGAGIRAAGRTAADVVGAAGRQFNSNRSKIRGQYGF